MCDIVMQGVRDALTRYGAEAARRELNAANLDGWLYEQLDEEIAAYERAAIAA